MASELGHVLGEGKDTRDRMFLRAEVNNRRIAAAGEAIDEGVLQVTLLRASPSDEYLRGVFGRRGLSWG